MNTSSRHWYQEPMVWMLLAIPLSSVCVGGVMLWLAVHNEDGLVVDDYYKRGLQINRTLERDALAARYALSSDLRFVGATGQIVATVESDQGFTYPENVTFGIYHAVKPGIDKEIVLSRISDKAYAGPAPQLIPGKWYASLHSDEWRLTGRIDWPADSISFDSSPQLR
jgi:hypothetical protein